ncbi:hypothetical protein [Chitinophaga sp. XS-30]|uniref:hypothetical protein n=1 Tax=Chitinophaga sp. XS-30 TaxID=2604421 RepID=UPI0011DDF9B6|nr:hypothetical protein [Chitinophaga sp. XS-30]QEH41827.1 hypothetical protein FW415_13435 [Chitinophaga sp. XS-30]
MNHRIYSILFLFLLGSGLRSYGQDTLPAKRTGIYFGINVGTWFPDGRNKVLGHPLLAGVTLGLRADRNAYALNFDLIGIGVNSTKEPVVITSGDSTVTQDDYSGMQFTFDYSRELWRWKRMAVEGLCGIGYGRLSYYNPDKDTDVYKGSFVLSPGVSLRWLLGRKYFVQLKAQYCVADYRLRDNTSTDFSGNYIITKLVFGGQ